VEQRFQLDGFFRIGWSDGNWSVVLAGVTTMMMMARVVVRLRHYFSCVGGLNDDVLFVLGTTFFSGKLLW
tara:strand:+ start:1139 stop:1348 length:210 start_codon:yes stop_codon:yes gene_type:complete